MAREWIAAAGVALVGACGSCRHDDAPAAGKATPLASAAFYRIDAGALPRCARGAACQVPLVLTALGDYHVNQDYPFKFVGDPAPATPVDGDGTFALGDARHGTLTLTFHPAAPGTAKLVGTFKLSVCNADTCEIEAAKLELVVPVG
jgi:hypothetical protein